MTEKVNGKGQNFSEFMREYKTLGFSETAATVDNILFAIGEKPLVLLVQRGNFPDIYDWAFPGGFIDSGETAGAAAQRELFEETGLTDVRLEPFCTVSTPGRDPRGRFTSYCFVGVLDGPVPPFAGDDAADAAWFEVDFAAKDDVYELILRADDTVLSAVMRVKRDRGGEIDLDATEFLSKNGIAFDHAKLILHALESL